jgi:hypothetical protein
VCYFVGLTPKLALHVFGTIYFVVAVENRLGTTVCSQDCSRKSFRVRGLLLYSDCGTSSGTAVTTSNPLAALTQLIGSCESMEATYCMGTDVDVCRMFDQYLYKVSSEL